jgi:dolichol-phosphate mannosyltransferase
VRGLASAAVRGWDAARGDALALMDGDGQHDPRLISQLVEALAAENADLAVASRYVDAGPSGLTGRRHWLSRAGTRVAGLLLRAPLTDPMSGCFVMRRSWYEAARPRLSAVGFKILVDLVASSRRRLRVAERPTALRPRSGGQSKLDARVVADLGALVAEKWTGGLIPARFVLFAVVGASGIVVNQLLFAAAYLAHAWPLAAALFGLFGAMAWNFALNNLLTFRDQRLRGAALLGGFAGFCAACTAGAAVNLMVGAGLHGLGARWGWASLAGAVAGGFWNFWAVRRTTWLEARASA